MNCCSKLFNKTLLATSLSFTLCCVNATFAAGATGDFTSGESSNVVKLENKLFNHAYDKDTPQHRVERLEQSVFGETKDGAFGDRVTALLQAVPNLDTPAPSAAPKTTADAQTGKHHRSTQETKPESGSDDDTMSMPGNYPAVSAIEKKIFGQAHDADPVGQRLARLETQVFGKPSASTDLSDRVDRLKQRTGIDVTKVQPPGSDWSDDEEENFGMPMSRTARRPDNNYSFGQHDLDLPYGATGTSLNDIASAAGIPIGSMPRMATRTPDPSTMSSAGLGEQVMALELDILGKPYPREPMAARLNRLEAQVFPQQKPMTEMPLPQRVQRLLSIYPMSPQQISQKTKPKGSDSDYVDTVTGTTAQSAQKSGGLSKIISSLSNMITGGSTGGFPTSNTYVTDPRTGMMIDTISGNIIDPATGTVIGNRGGTQYSPGYSSGLGSMNSFGNFNNGFSPFGSPYMGGNPYGYGGGSGVRFGLGSGRGMWP
jgi:hypothetical protein